jgi:hypothetical protein
VRTFPTSLILALLVAGCSADRPKSSRAVTFPPRLDSYFQDYCDYTGNLGIGFDPLHTYDYRFRQRLKTMRDPELKRLFVLQHLHQDVEFALDDLERGVIRTGQSSSRSLTLLEWQNTQRSIQTQIDDLAAYTAFTNFTVDRHDPLAPVDPNLDTGWIDELRGRLRNVTNAPAANNRTQRTPR